MTPPKKTPTSSLSAIDLLAKRVWYRSRARIRGIWLEDVYPTWTSMTRPSPAMRIPQEIIEIIVAHLIYDLPSLRSCSLTCYSWYIAAIPHLHPTLIVHTNTGSWNRKCQWPNPILCMHRLGLLPFVKTLLISAWSPEFTSKLFNRRTLHQLSALSNVQTLKITGLDIPSFMPRIHPYFGPFMPTVRSLHLELPKGSNRQIIFFVGLFQRLDDLSLIRRFYEEDLEEDLTLIPPFTPSLQGRLVVAYWSKAGLFQEMIRLFGGIRFRAVNLCDVGETQLLLNACAETLQELKLHPDDLLEMTSLQDFDLSRNKSLRILEVPASATINAWQIDPDRASTFLKYALSTIQSPTFSQVRVVYLAYDVREVDPECFHDQFELFREMRKVRDFRLALHAIGWEYEAKSMMSRLKAAVEAEKERGEFNDLFSELLVTFAPDLWGENTI